jgi:hypothetical protein
VAHKVVHKQWQAANAAQADNSSKLVILARSAGHQWPSAFILLLSPATSMAPVPRYFCPCFKCKPKKKERVKRTILAHFKENLDHLNHLRASGVHQDTLAFVQNCHDEIMQLLHSIDEEFDPRSSYPAGECIFTCTDKY